MVTYSAIIADFAGSHRIPALAAWGRFTELGGVLSYATNLPDIFLRSAGYVDKILKGAKPAQLPIEQPAKFELEINMKTVRALGIAVPRNVLLQATKLIE
jgi:putative ABC transport system substrate-binding protein